MAAIRRHWTSVLMARSSHLGGDDLTVVLGDARSGEFLAMIEGFSATPQAMTFLTNDRLLTRDARGVLVLWRLERNHAASGPQVRATVLWQVKEDSAPDVAARALAATADGQFILRGSQGVIDVLQTADGRSARRLTNADSSSTILSLSSSTDGQYVAAGHADGTVRLWDFKGNKALQAWNAGQGAVRSVAFQPGKPTLATGGSDVRLWHVPSARLLVTFNKHTRPIRDLAFSIDGQFLASASEDQSACVWETGAITQRLQQMGIGWE